MDKSKFLSFGYKYALKPVLFKIDPETVHDWFTRVGETLGMDATGRYLTSTMLDFEDPKLEKLVDGIKFKNPIGLAAGFDYDGHMAEIMSQVGFGFNTVGTVTALPYEGNGKPRLGRLPRSRSLLVNKGFKSEGAEKVAERLDKMDLTDKTVGISVGSSNVPQIDTIQKAIDDYLTTFETFIKRDYVKYFELNISCPNTAMKEPFSDTGNFKQLTSAVMSLNLKRPIYVKMANELPQERSDELVRVILDRGMSGMIFSNLVKKRDNPFLEKDEIEAVADLKGNFSGRPTTENALNLIKHTREKFGKDYTIIGCGGTFNGQDAKAKLDAGADLVQMITGMIFEGPQVIGEINRYLAEH